MDIELQYEKLLRYCLMKTKNRELAEDIVQETYLRFWQSHSYKETGKELAYLYTMARNLCIDEFRKNKPQTLEEYEEIPADDKSEPEHYIMQMDIENALENLPEDLREIIMLRYTNDMSVMDIAKITNLSRFAVHRRIKEGLALLKKYMKEGDV
ncbi:MAG: RNA polymerase sigma factor [Eubacterium sp.]|nr:RNA polymerase sigma factor [Eubacterium sp.]